MSKPPEPTKGGEHLIYANHLIAQARFYRVDPDKNNSKHPDGGLGFHVTELGTGEGIIYGVIPREAIQRVLDFDNEHPVEYMTLCDKEGPSSDIIAEYMDSLRDHLTSALRISNTVLSETGETAEGIRSLLDRVNGNKESRDKPVE